MKRTSLLVLFLGLIASRTAMAQSICAGAEGRSQACAPACSGQIVNDEVVPNSNSGVFNVGNGNQGNGNDGFNNVGSFNIGSANQGNCNSASGGTVGSCDVSNNQGRMVLRFCNVYPADRMCSPSGYLPEFSQPLQTQIAAVVASCNGGPPATPLPPVTPTPQLAQALPLTTAPAPAPVVDPLAARSPTAHLIQGVSDSDADIMTLLDLFLEHLAQEKTLGRKLKL